jgi:hypothetical protein
MGRRRRFARRPGARCEADMTRCFPTRYPTHDTAQGMRLTPTDRN